MRRSLSPPAGGSSKGATDEELRDAFVDALRERVRLACGDVAVGLGEEDGGAGFAGRSHGVVHAVNPLVAALVLTLAGVVGSAGPGTAHLVGERAVVAAHRPGDRTHFSGKTDHVVDDAKPTVRPIWCCFHYCSLATGPDPFRAPVLTPASSGGPVKGEAAQSAGRAREPPLLVRARRYAEGSRAGQFML
jgi:hypothetical protein